MSDYSGTFLGKEFTITENACHLLSVRNEYALLAEQGWEHYEKTYDGYKNFQTFAKKGIREGYLLIENYFSQTVARLVSEGYYDIDKRALLQEYGYEIFADWREIEEAVIELSEAANQAIKESAELRELRKDTRARAAGIGIGAAGTIGALAVSGAYNLLSGIAHTGANAVGNAKTISQIRRQQDILTAHDFYPPYR